MNLTSKEKELIESKRSFIKHSTDIPVRIFLKSRNLWSMILAFLCSQWALYFLVASMPVYLQQGRHLSESYMKLATSSLFIFGIGGALLAGLFSDWLGKIN